ncbi:translocation/assembly module TamB domain-containing protein [Ancylobacter sp. A5.8]|uniref:translocation/assembly module TamB domain-containing protein n=1 Tax=Ancylobacter gelatini TaxID=2919920 RepID=UPI001F4EA136|nr:translocation/assembly module TamB domain-containing protein [Ancylobacter gelatini]MCJ8141874.1 translocation/assembly module TamB domain-containing protein [Ancylobacter gelatini]
MVRRILKSFAYLVVGLVVLLALLFGAIQTGPGKSVLARLASSLASTPDLRIEISDIGGFIPSQMSVGAVTLADREGEFARIDAIRLDWSPLALLSGRVDVTALDIAKVAVARMPLPAQTPVEPASEGSSFALPVHVARFAIDEIALAEPVVGHEATLSLQASADLAALGRALSLDFALERHDAPGKIAGTARFAPETGQLDLDLTAQEPAGGLIARAAGMDGLPELDATLKGTGTLDAWDGRLNLSAGDAAQIGGVAGIRAVPQGHRVTFALDADMAKLLPADLAPLFEGRTELAGAALVDPALLVTIETATARAAGFGASATGTFDASANIPDLAFHVTLGEAARFAALAPGVNWGSVALDGTLKGTLQAPTLVTNVAASGLSGAGYGAQTVTLAAGTVPDPAGNLAITVTGDASGLSASDPQVASALGTTGRFSATANRPAGGEPVLTALAIELTALTARFAGTADARDIDGTLHLERLNLAALSPLAGRTLAGEARADITVDASADFSRISLDVKGSTSGISTGIAAVDELFGRTTTLEGALARGGANAISINDLKLIADGLQLDVNGRIAETLADLQASVALSDLSRLDPRLTGAMNAQAAFTGDLANLGATARIEIPRGTAMKQPIENLALDLNATDLTGNVGGTFRLTGDVAGRPATGSGALSSEPGTRRLRGLDVAIGSVNAKGDLTLTEASGLLDGRLIVAAGNLADLSALALTPLAGQLNADVTLSSDEGRQRVAVKADGADIAAAGQRVGSARIDATVTDPTGIPLLDGTINLSGVDASGVRIANASVVAKGGLEGTDLTVDALAEGTTLRAAGRLTPREGGAVLRLDRLTAERTGVRVATSAPATFTLVDGTVTIDRLALATGGGSATVSGSAGQRLDLNVDLRALPLALADLASPGLGLSGTLAGNARITGTPAAPGGNYELRITRLSSPVLAQQGAGPFDIAAQGTLADGRAGIRATISGQNLQALTITGSVPVAAGELDLAIRGAVNLAIANTALATSGARVSGIANIDATLRGTPAAPRAGGTVRVSGGRFDDSVNGVALDQITAVLTGSERSVTVTSFSARTSNGGSLSGRGNVGLDAAAGFPGRIEVDLTNAGLINSDLMRLVAEGRVAVEGAFLVDPRITGRLVVRALDVNIPDRFPGGVQNLNVRHVNAGPRNTRRTAGRAAASRRAPASGGMPLDLTVSAPNNVFVRGLGINAELGGEIRVTGTSAAPVTNGAFEMRRGSFDILGRRLTFTRGRVTFAGSTDPELDFVAETTSADVTARILVTGPASQPEISFTSTPTLPQDEVLARLMFGRSAGSLTAGQAVQVAQTIAQFSGGAGMLDSVRRSLGVDALDVGTDSAGTGGQVGLGKRLNDNIYLGVRQGTTPNSSRVTVDVDVTNRIRLQGATGADGSAEVGIGAQWDY